MKRAMRRAKTHCIGIVGGTGAEGLGLAARWSAAGHTILIGSRDPHRAEVAAAQVARLVADTPGAVSPLGTGNEHAADAGDVVVLAVPYDGQADVLTSVRAAVQGKTLVSVVVPLRPPSVSTVHVPGAGSAAVEAQTLLGPAVHVVAAFHNVAAARLADLSADVGCDVLVCGDRASAKAVVLDLVTDAGAVGFDAGPLANAVVPEALTSVLIGLNKRYGTRDAGLRITNVPHG